MGSATCAAYKAAAMLPNSLEWIAPSSSILRAVFSILSILNQNPPLVLALMVSALTQAPWVDTGGVGSGRGYFDRGLDLCSFSWPGRDSK